MNNNSIKVNRRVAKVNGSTNWNANNERASKVRSAVAFFRFAHMDSVSASIVGDETARKYNNKIMNEACKYLVPDYLYNAYAYGEATKTTTSADVFRNALYQYIAELGFGARENTVMMLMNNMGVSYTSGKTFVRRTLEKGCVVNTKKVSKSVFKKHILLTIDELMGTCVPMKMFKHITCIEAHKLLIDTIEAA